MKTILVVAGLDPSAGAGFLADARVAADHGVRCVGVVSALTVQDTTGVREVLAAPRDVVTDQLRALLGDVEVDAVKLGALADERLAEVVIDALAATRAPVVWDPVIMPTRGGVALYGGDVRALAGRLLPEVRLVTPNLAEAAALTGLAVNDVAGMRVAAAALRAAGAAAALVKGGHLSGDPIDVLDGNGEPRELGGARIDAGPLHGTGCVLSTAIACRLAGGAALADAVDGARAYLRERLASPLEVGRGARCLV